MTVREVRTDEAEPESPLARLVLTKDARLADVEQDLGGELDLVDQGEAERKLHGLESVSELSRRARGGGDAP